MRAIILDGAATDDQTGLQMRNALMAQLEAQGWEVVHRLLREQKIGNCAGCFGCWVQSPGTCIVADDNRSIAEAIVASDLLIYLTPVTFGGYGAALKQMVDHQIQNISPFFQLVDGETHHHQRYARYPDFLAVGWLAEPDPRAEAIFQHLVARNAINMFAPITVSGVVYTSQPQEQQAAAVAGWLQQVHERRSTTEPALPHFEAVIADPAPIERALLLVGSPRTKKSNSAALGGYLLEQLQVRTIATETIYLHTLGRSPERRQALHDAVAAADLVLLAFPLYIDTLPAPVIAALEAIAAQRRKQVPVKPQRFAAIANCGFPEAQHTAAALAVCAEFAEQSGFTWAGGLALGGGEGKVQGKPLAAMGGRTIWIRKALELAADELAAGKAIPSEAKELMTRPVMPDWAYRLVGSLHWVRHAHSRGVALQIGRRPYQTR
jgi:multimeric flavodoxin WrbA